MNSSDTSYIPSSSSSSICKQSCMSLLEKFALVSLWPYARAIIIL
jgi:hypothetical protein